MLTSGSSEMTTLVEKRTEWIPRILASYGDHAVWSEVAKAKSGSRIRGWSADGRGVRTVLENIQGDVCEFAMNETHLAGTMGDGIDCNLVQREARFWAVRRDDGKFATPSLSPVLYHEPLTFWETATNGTFLAATASTYPGEWGFLLARIQGWDIRILTKEYPAWFAMTSKYLYVMMTPRNKFQGRASEIRRYDLEKFDQIGEPYEGVLRPPAEICDLVPC